MERLTKERAIQLHRDMWNWIASELNKNPELEVVLLKEQYIKNLNLNHGSYRYTCEIVANECFCCEYAIQQATQYGYDYFGDNDFEMCEHCPLRWGTEDNTEDFFCENGLEHNYEALDGHETTGLWQLIHYAKEINLTPEEKINIARQIANLPEK